MTLTDIWEALIYLGITSKIFFITKSLVMKINLEKLDPLHISLCVSSLVKISIPEYSTVP